MFLDSIRFQLSCGIGSQATRTISVTQFWVFDTFYFAFYSIKAVSGFYRVKCGLWHRSVYALINKIEYLLSSTRYLLFNLVSNLVAFYKINVIFSFSPSSRFIANYKLLYTVIHRGNFSYFHDPP